MVAERYDGLNWPATISVGPGYYGLRIDTDHGTAVEYVAPNFATALGMRSVRPSIDPYAVECRMAGYFTFAVHAGARCEEAA